MSNTDADTLLPTEPFWEAIVAEQMEERLEFEPWATTTETVQVGVTCSPSTGCDTYVQGSVSVSAW
jgi:hypothetical protein